MKRYELVLGAMCLCPFLFGSSVVYAQANGSIVGWGYVVLVAQEDLNSLVAVAGGAHYSLGLKSDGTIVAWGLNAYGQCNIPAPNADFVAVAGGGEHSLGLKSDGTIVAWGVNSSEGECNVPAPNADFIAIAAGQFHSLGLKSDGTIVAWGAGNYFDFGQCNVPAPNADFIAIAAGYFHSLGLKSDGTIVAWGDNYYGQCNIPAPNADFIALAAGLYHSLGLKSDGTIVAWGVNSSEGECNVPAPNADFIAIAAGQFHSLGLKSDGTIVAWGDNDYGQCNIPAPNADFIAIAAGYYHSLGLKSGGTIAAWGSNSSGQCNVPAPNADFIAVAAGQGNSLGLKSDGTIMNLGTNSDVPAPNADFIAIAAGQFHSLGLKSDGTIMAWGDNDYGQCNIPAPNADFVAVAGGGEYSLGLKSDGTIVAWGSNSSGQCNVPVPNMDFIAVTGGGSHSLGLKSDGTIVAWGSNNSGQCNVPAPNADFIAVAASGEHSLGLKSDGTIVAWGDNDYGQCNIPAPNADFIAVAAGQGNSLGLKSDGTIMAWGDNDYGQCNIPAPNADFVAVAGGGEYSLGLKITEGEYVFPPMLFSPASNYEIEESVVFQWQSVTDAEYYQVAISATPQMNSPVWTTTTTNNSKAYTPGPEMITGAEYYWSVRVYAQGQWSAYAPSRAITKIFIPEPLACPVAITPINGAGIALPDYFSWMIPSGATKVLIEISDSADFGTIIKRGESTLDHILVSEMTIGNPYYWRLKAVGEGTESDWSEAEPFIVLLSTTVPSVPARISPVDDETIGGSSVAFAWSESPGATHYYLDISISEEFPLGSNLTWNVGPVYAMGKLVSILPTSTTLYWRVSAANSAGKGEPSTVGYVHVINATEPLSSATITIPSVGAIISQNGTILANGLVTGYYVGTVTTEWFLDGTAFKSATYEMDGKGFETGSVAVPTSDLGSHELTLQVMGPSTVVSPARSFTVVERTWGAPYKLSLIAINPVVEISDTTTVYCRVLDELGRLVESDNETVVAITLGGGGVEGPGSLEPVSMAIANGLGHGTYTAPTEICEVTLSAAAGTLIGDEIGISIQYARLDVLKARAHKHLDRLGALEWELYSTYQSPVNPTSFDVTESRYFVNNCQSGDEQRLVRLNLFLRLLNRAYYHNPDIHNTDPGDDDPVQGAMVLSDDVAKAYGHVCLVALSAIHRAVLAGTEVGWMTTANRVVSNTILWGLDKVIKKTINAACGGDRETASILGDRWQFIYEIFRDYIEGPTFGGIAGAIEDIGLRTYVGNVVIKDDFVARLQPVMDDVIETLSSPDWQGGDDTRAILQTEYAIDYARITTETEHADYLATDKAYNSVFIEAINEIEGTLSIASKWFKIGKVVNNVIEGTIYYATGFDCNRIVRHNSWCIAMTARDYIITPYYPSSVAISSNLVSGYFATRANRILPISESQTLEANMAIESVLNRASSDAKENELLLRDLECAVQQADTIEAQDALLALYRHECVLRDNATMLAAPVYAALYQGRLLIPGLVESLDSVSRYAADADSLKMDLWAFTEMWLSDPDDESSRLAIQSLVTRAIDAYKEYLEKASAIILELLTTPAVPSLVMTNVQAPDSVYCGAAASISADIQNLGAGTARNVKIMIAADTAVVQPLTSHEVAIDSIAAGEKVHVDWNLLFISMNLPPDSVHAVYCALLADGGNAVTDAVHIIVPLLTNPAANVDPGKETPKSSLMAVYPNPFNPTVTIELYCVESNVAAEIAIFDVSGRMIRMVYSGRLNIGANKFVWNGQSDAGGSVASGVYFCRMRSGDQICMKKLILLR